MQVDQVGMKNPSFIWRWTGNFPPSSNVWNCVSPKMFCKFFWAIKIQNVLFFSCCINQTFQLKLKQSDWDFRGFLPYSVVSCDLSVKSYIFIDTHKWISIILTLKGIQVINLFNVFVWKRPSKFTNTNELRLYWLILQYKSKTTSYIWTK